MPTTTNAAARPGLHRLVAALAVLGLTVAGLLASSPAAEAAAVMRVAGSNRVATAVAAATSEWATADEVLLATSEDFPDAIAAVGLAARRDAPILLTPTDRLDPEAAQALETLETTRVTILGGPKAVSTAVEDELVRRGYAVTRLAGNDRFTTAARLAEVAATSGEIRTVALALGARGDGRDAWPDALSAASLAGLDAPAPTLLTLTGTLPDATRQALTELQPTHVIALGGTSAIADSVLDEVRALGLEVTRIAGRNRFATSMHVAFAAAAGAPGADSKIDATRAVFVSGDDFPDALAAGAVAARRSAPLLLVPQDRLADSIDGYLRRDDTRIASGTIIGGPNVVSDFVVSEIDAAITGQPRPQPEPECPPNSSPDCQYTYEHPIETWEDLAECESGQRWSLNSGNGYYGGLQFSKSTWDGVGGAGYPHENSKWEQIHRGEILVERNGGSFRAWPHCSRELGLS